MQGQGGFGRPGGPERRNRSSGNGGKKAGFGAVFGIFLEVCKVSEGPDVPKEPEVNRDVLWWRRPSCERALAG